MLLENKKAGPRTLLSDKIKGTLRQMMNTNIIGKEAGNELLGMFNPRMGIQLGNFKNLGNQKRFE